MGRPSAYSDEMSDVICGRLAEGETLRAICRDDDMPGQRTVFTWLRQHEDFRQQYARAREVQADAWADDIVEIADNATNDWMERHGDEDAGWRANGEHIQRSKIRIDTRKWLMAKSAPKKYGERVQQEISGPDGGPVEMVAHSDIDRAKALAALIARTKATHGGG